MIATTFEAPPFELVEDGVPHVSAYGGRERRRSRPRVSVSDSLAEARRGVWTVTLGRAVLVTVIWLGFVAPVLEPGHALLAALGPLGYVLVELVATGLVLRHLASVARAAAHY